MKTRKSFVSASLPHPAEEIQAFASNWDQYDYRKSAILGFMEQHGIVLTELDAFVSRGGHTEPVHSGVYRITPKMLEQSRSMKYGKPLFPISASGWRMTLLEQAERFLS